MSVFASVKRTGVKAQQLDAEGNLVEVETREDEEQAVKYEQIIELLLAAGYFRARISGLSQFDKVVGGMVWSITASNVDIDIDLTLPSVNACAPLSEKIVTALTKMKCPSRIDPHQIQGLDCIHLFPVFQWLVKKVIETREEMGDYIRNFAVAQFSKENSTPQDEEIDSRMNVTTATVANVKRAYKPQRRYRRPAGARAASHISQSRDPDEESDRVHTTLLEYGQRYKLSRAAQEKASKKGIDDKIPAGLAGQQKEKDDGVDDAEEEERRVRALMAAMSATEGREGAVSSSALGGMIGMQSDEIRQLVNEYNEKQAGLGAGGDARGGGAQNHKRLIASLEKQIALMDKRHAEIKELYDRLSGKYNATQAELDAVLAHNAKIDAELAKFEAMQTPENSAVLARLSSLVTLNESLKKQETDFRASCKEEVARLQEAIEKLKAGEAGGDDEEKERLRLINEQFEADKDRLQKIRVLLGKKNRDIAAITRLIDEIPSRSELTQYQKRFVELYNQVAAKLTETKQYYTLYNTLDDTKLYMSKELSLLNSIHDSFERAMATAQNKEQFLTQFENIVTGVKANLEKVDKRRDNEKAKRDKLNDEYLELVDKQRLYYKTVKEFQEECRKNENLLAQFEAA
ncbi:coiled-coil domain-containing protein 93 [Capsaspora owczarzaki ATCC 30864]|uniref:Coiled-coil domain-containing protein 93 n=2 Tax=Capsaspora owczarzaki (strain ATCC 30864) TaxID=595528 RepID=A0A0D2VJJ9_CAPO3|nr:coiled-coil domain-containing protein 93 [Capsaspora owczarzaki ATCC 30864]